MRRPRRQSGFTLLELMVVVALIAILAAVAIPSFASDGRKSKGDSESAAMIAELRVREEQYHAETGRYLATGVNEAATFPATQQAEALPIGAMPTEWTKLRIRPPETEMRCGYVVVAGQEGETGGAIATSFGYSAPQKDWFYVVAHCDLDDNPAVDSYYFTSSDSSEIQKLNWGK
ncbi:MAG TPA: prepilin-type N-terminal cleavage/methylation domain-containing protein [Kofleriaceae bacterium]|jgi:prepilin-type N-terminal cleavage/methylation domain-containing protein